MTERENSDPDWAPQLPSIWDVDEDPEDGLAEDAAASPLPVRETSPEWLKPQAWLQAEAACARMLLDAATAVARLDERLLRLPGARRDGLCQRIALSVTSDVLWSEGVRLRPEHLALADRDRIGRSADEDQAVARAVWALRRQTRQMDAPDRPDRVRRFLGLHRRIHDTPDLDDAYWLGGLDDHALSEWSDALHAVAGAHPLTRAAMAFHLWRGFGLGAPERLCEPLVLAARLAGDMAMGGLIAVPIALPDSRSGHGMDPRDRLHRWYGAVLETAQRMQRLIDDLDAWRMRAQANTCDLNGASPARLIDLFEASPVLSAKDCARALERSAAQTRQLLSTFEMRGLIRETTGQRRFRFWSAKV